MEARPQEEKPFPGPQGDFPLSVTLGSLRQCSMQHRDLITCSCHTFLSQNKQRPGAVPEHRALYNVPEK